jgi:hypothetical protein
MIESQSITTVAPALLYLADQYPLSITLSGTPEQVEQRMTEVVKLLAGSRYSKPTFVLAVGGDFLHSMRGANLADVSSATREGYAFKLRDLR